VVIGGRGQEEDGNEDRVGQRNRKGDTLKDRKEHEIGHKDGEGDGEGEGEGEGEEREFQSRQ
jgi:hypothetical protein